MPPTLPPRVREHFGEQTAEVFSEWLEAFVHEHAVARDEYREVLSRLDVLEERFVQLEDRIDQRFEQVDQRFEQMQTRMNERFEQVNEHFEQVDRRFDTMDAKLDRMNDRILSMTRWLIGLIALFGSLGTALLAVAQFG